MSKSPFEVSLCKPIGGNLWGDFHPVATEFWNRCYNVLAAVLWINTAIEALSQTIKGEVALNDINAQKVHFLLFNGIAMHEAQPRVTKILDAYWNDFGYENLQNM